MKEEIIVLLKHHISYSQKDLDIFKQRFDAGPAKAFESSSQAFKHARDIEWCTTLLKSIEKQGEDFYYKTFLQRLHQSQMSASKFDIQSSSCPTHNLMRVYDVQVQSDVLAEIMMICDVKLGE